MATIAQTHDGFREGDAHAIATVQGWVRQVVFGARWRLLDLEAAQQDVLIELLNAVRRGSIRDPQAFQKFVWTVAKRVCLELHRRHARAAETPLPEEDPDSVGDAARENPAHAPDERLERSREYELLLYVYRRLSEECRQLWRWVYGERRSAAEVAEALGVKTGTARVRVHRCLDRARVLAREAAS